MRELNACVHLFCGNNHKCNLRHKHRRDFVLPCASCTGNNMIAITMNSNSKIIATALHFAWANGDIENFLHFFDDNVLYQRHSSARDMTDSEQKTLRCRGKQAMLNQLEVFRRKYELLDLEIIYMVAEGSKVASRCVIEKRNRVTGEIYKSELCHFWTVRNDKVMTLLEFGSSTHQAEARHVMPPVPETNVIQFSATPAKR